MMEFLSKKRKWLRMAAILLVAVLFVPMYKHTSETFAGGKQAAGKVDYKLAENVQDGVILHCWNWSYNNIKDHMQEIAQAGYSAIQTSPVQQPKDYTYAGNVDTNVGTPNGCGANDGQWWKLYQPVTFSICDNGQTWLGTKEEFTQMCAEAEKYGVKVIVDIVANHMGNNTGWKNSMSDITDQIGTYWNPEMLTDPSYWHINDLQCWMSDGRNHLTQGTIGMPDLNTSDARVQQMVLNLLKECVDCGADGFRFDAAKHIETPDDSADLSSDFWPNVINGIRSYADHDLFIYGEILNTVGDNFDISSYTKYMSVTDNATGDNKRNDVRYGNASSAANGNYAYQADKVVVWNESHDTYVGGGSSYLADDDMIKQTWAIVGCRKDAAALFLARSYYSDQLLDENGNKKDTSNLVQTEMGAVGTMTWCDPSVSAVNNFHNAFIGQSESLSSNGSTVYIERGTTGVVIVKLDGPGEVSLQARSMRDGTYTDRVTGNTFTVSGGVIKGNVESEDGIAVVYNTNAVPSNTVSVKGGTITEDTVQVTLGLANATSGTYQIDNGKVHSYTGSTTITIGKDVAYGNSIKLTLTATNGSVTYISKHVYNKNKFEIKEEESTSENESFESPDGTYKIYMKNTAGWKDVTCYAWADESTSNKTWPGVKMTYIGNNTYCYASDVNYPNVIFSNNGGSQTADLNLPGNHYLYDNGSGQWEKYQAEEETTKPDEPETSTEEETTEPETSTEEEATEPETSTEEETTEPDTEEETTTEDEHKGMYPVYVRNDAGWSDMYCYSWLDDNTNAAPWPGEKMEYEGGNVWKYWVNKDYKNIIFNNGTGTQTSDLKVPGYGYIYNNAGGNWSEYAEEPTTDEKESEEETTSAYVKVYLKNSANWSTVNCYMWNENGDVQSWPGVKMTYEGNNIWSYIVPDGYDNIIFNNGAGSQTGDMTFKGNGSLYDNGTGQWSSYR